MTQENQDTKCILLLEIPFFPEPMPIPCLPENTIEEILNKLIKDLKKEGHEEFVEELEKEISCRVPHVMMRVYEYTDVFKDLPYNEEVIKEKRFKILHVMLLYP